MTDQVPMPDRDGAWVALDRHADRLRGVHLRALFADDPGRFEALSAGLGDLVVDFSKEKIDRDALSALLSLASASRVEGRRDALFSGARVNVTEGRAVLHSALRGGAGEQVLVDGADVMPAVNATRDRFLAFAEDVRSGRYASHRGQSFTDIVAIAIGGSSLGPEMATAALAPWHDGPRVHYVSNVDGTQLADTLKAVDPNRTLIIVASKTFTTLETMTNARSARAWLVGALGEASARGHLAAVSTNLAATRDFGIDEDRVFGFWDWVGGRFSVWSAIGLPLAIAIGADGFRAFLDGARRMDVHFRTAPLASNLPVLLAMIGIWRRNGMGCSTTAIVPYDQRLARLPAYLQQLEMESNGKSVTLEKAPAGIATAPVIWGEPGSDAQHSFFQLLHQGTDVIPVDFLLAACPEGGTAGHHVQLAANAFAQSAAMAFGKTEHEVRAEMTAGGASGDTIDRLAAHRTFPGDRPSTTVLYDRLDPDTLGMLMALFEHKVSVQGAIWSINSYDQWGVELGKDLAQRLLPAVMGESGLTGLDSSTAGLIARFKTLRDCG